MQSQSSVFDSKTKAAQRSRTIQWIEHGEQLNTGRGEFELEGPKIDLMQKEIASRLCDRLDVVKRRFRRVLILGGAAHAVIECLANHNSVVGGVDSSEQISMHSNDNRGIYEKDSNSASSYKLCVIHCDTDIDTLNSCAKLCQRLDIPVVSHHVNADDFERHGIDFLPADVERYDDSLSGKDDSQTKQGYVHNDSDNPEKKVDLVVACLGLHWQNNLPLVFSKIRKSLKPDGLFLGSLYGEDTLHEMRVSCMIAESERQSGFETQRVSPMVLIRDAGSLLSAAGFALPSVDVDTITMRYRTPFDAVTHIREMGESSAAAKGNSRIQFDSALAASAIYQVGTLE